MTVSSRDEATAFFRQLCSERQKGTAAADRSGIPGNGPVKVIIKPLDTQGSRGVQVCGSEQEILDKYYEAARWSSNHQVIVEQFATGREFVVESLVLNGQYHTLCIGDTLYFDIPDAFAAKSRIFPTTAAKCSNSMRKSSGDSACARASPTASTSWKVTRST